MKQKILYIIAVFILLFSCDIQKKALKTKSSTETKKDIVSESVKVTEEKREGGKIISHIKPIEQRERDSNGNLKELIDVIKEGGLTKTIYYKPDGKVDVECTADEIWTRIEEKINQRDNTIVEADVKEKDKEKEEKFDSSFIIYIILGVIFIVLIVAFFGFKLLSQNTKALNLLLGSK